MDTVFLVVFALSHMKLRLPPPEKLSNGTLSFSAFLTNIYLSRAPTEALCTGKRTKHCYTLDAAANAQRLV